MTASTITTTQQDAIEGWLILELVNHVPGYEHGTDHQFHDDDGQRNDAAIHDHCQAVMNDTNHLSDAWDQLSHAEQRAIALDCWEMAQTAAQQLVIL